MDLSLQACLLQFDEGSLSLKGFSLEMELRVDAGEGEKGLLKESPEG